MVSNVRLSSIQILSIKLLTFSKQLSLCSVELVRLLWLCFIPKRAYCFTDLGRACAHEVVDFRVCVAAVERLNAFHFSVDFNF